jgi:hypothetical protein
VWQPQLPQNLVGPQKPRRFAQDTEPDQKRKKTEKTQEVEKAQKTEKTEKKPSLLRASHADHPDALAYNAAAASLPGALARFQR